MSRLLLILTVILFASSARADGAGTNVKSIGLAMAYVLPVGCAGFATGVASAYILVDEGLPARWRTAGYLCGATSIGLGVYLALDDGYASGTAGVITTIPLVVGTAALVTTLWAGVPRDLVGDQARLSPWFVAGGGGLAWTSRF